MHTDKFWTEVRTPGSSLRAKPPIHVFFLVEKEKSRLCMNRVKSKVAAARFSGLVNLIFSRQTVFFFFECKHMFIDKPMVITEPTVPSARGLGSKLYPSNMPRMLNKDLARFKQS